MNNITDIFKKHKYFVKTNGVENDQYFFRHIIKSIFRYDYYGTIAFNKNKVDIQWSFWREEDESFGKLKNVDHLEETPFWFQELISIVINEYQNNKLLIENTKIKITRINSGRSMDLKSIDNELKNLHRKFLRIEDSLRNRIRRMSLNAIILEDVQEILLFLNEMLSVSNIDWSKDSKTSIIYGLLVGYNDKKLIELQQEFKWENEQVQIIKRDHDVINYIQQNYKDKFYLPSEYENMINSLSITLDYLTEIIDSSNINWRETEALFIIFGILKGWDNSSNVHMNEKFKLQENQLKKIEKANMDIKKIIGVKKPLSFPKY